MFALFFRHSVIAHLIYYSENITSICIGKPKIHLTCFIAVILNKVQYRQGLLILEGLYLIFGLLYQLKQLHSLKPLLACDCSITNISHDITVVIYISQKLKLLTPLTLH